MAKDGAMPQKQERLIFSETQLEIILMEESGLIRKFYNGIEFTDRRNIDSDQSPFKDAYTVYEGIVDNSKITFQDP